jgi:hypothetical protein
VTRFFPIIAMVLAACDLAAAATVPLPRPRPPVADAVQPEAPPPEAVAPAGPSACQARLADRAVLQPLPPLVGPGECGAADVVRLDAIIMPDHAKVAVTPPATLRCTMAEALSEWVREEAGPTVGELAAPLRAIENFDSYECRGRNRIPGAKVSEHGRANALDVRSLKLANGQSLYLTDPTVSRDLRERLRASACARFTTVLGPGSDGYHENHVHLDLTERRNGYRICQWDIREPEDRNNEPEDRNKMTEVPLPRPRPFAAAPGQRL